MSPVVSNAILLVGVIAAGLTLFGFSSSKLNLAAISYSDKVHTDIEKMEERFQIAQTHIQHEIDDDKLTL